MDLTPAQQDIIAKATDAEGIPGVAVTIVVDGAIVAAGCLGHRDLERGLPMTANTVSPICSLTKSFTGVAVMQLVEAGKLWLDEPVVSYIPSFRVADEEASRKITPRMLLSHRSGMGRTGHQPRMFEERVSPYKDRADLVGRLRDVVLQSPPNAVWSYCNEGYVTLGLLVETLSGIGLEEYFETRIFQPVGMESTYTSFKRWRAASDRARGYDTSAGGHEESHLPEDYRIYLSTGGICSTAHDLARYQIATMAYSGSPLLSAGSLDQMHTVSTPYGDTGWGYGFGWRIGWNGPRKVVEHGGSLPGVATHSLMVPSEKIGVIVVTNLGRAEVARLAERLADTLLEEPLYRPHVDDPLPFTTAYRLSDEDLSSYVGSYIFQQGTVDVAVDGAGLGFIRHNADGGDPESRSRVAVGDDVFMAGEDGSVVYFLRSDGAAVTGLLERGAQHNRAE